MDYFQAIDLVWLLPLIIWSMVWKGVALWKAARNSDTTWFVAFMLVNTVGLLEIAYIYFIRADKSKKTS